MCLIQSLTLNVSRKTKKKNHGRIRFMWTDVLGVVINILQDWTQTAGAASDRMGWPLQKNSKSTKHVIVWFGFWPQSEQRGLHIEPYKHCFLFFFCIYSPVKLAWAWFAAGHVMLLQISWSAPWSVLTVLPPVFYSCVKKQEAYMKCCVYLFMVQLPPAFTDSSFFIWKINLTNVVAVMFSWFFGMTLTSKWNCI